ncbi:MAG TPA: hypothetical protein DEB25_00140 [Desulfobulbaceae bacterium]|nr:hypothetical protein [Desulfobulbaceae bacterium]
MPHSKNSFTTKNELVRAEIIRFLKHSPPPMRSAVIALLPAAKWAIDSGYHHRIASNDNTPLKSWRCLLALLSAIAVMQGDSAMLLQVSRDLLMIGNRMEPPEEVLRQSSEVLLKALRADLYLCRMRNADGSWVAQFCDAPGMDSVPMIPRVLEEGFAQHPVAQAVTHRNTDFVVSNDLHAIEQGGQSVDCMLYHSGYRSRLAFILRQGHNRPPFGLIQLYTKQEYGFEDYDENFLSKFASIVSLTVGRRIAVARDALEKAAGAMAHFGNNALNIIRNQAEFCGELIVDIEAGLQQAQELAADTLRLLPADALGRAKVEQLAASLQHSSDLNQLSEQLDGVLSGVSRMTNLIGALKKSVEKPRLMHYLLGEKVLDLE